VFPYQSLRTGTPLLRARSAFALMQSPVLPLGRYFNLLFTGHGDGINQTVTNVQVE
jgi:hypothetical protein